MKKGHIPSVGSRELVRRLSCAKVIIRDLLSLAPSPACELFHHAKKDQHTWSQPCPCVERYNARLKAATDFLSSPNAELCDAAPPAASDNTRTVNGAAFTSANC